MKKVIVTLFIFFSANALQAQYSPQDTEDVIDYESIVRELTPVSRTTYKNYGPDPLSQVRFHVGVGFANSLISIDSDETNINTRESLKGVQAKFGIDLLSPFWRAEGGIVTYETHKDDFGNRYSLKEFDLSLISITPVGKLWGYKFGGGLSARYLDFTASGKEKVQYTTPSANIQMGILAHFSPKMTISTELSYRKSMTKDTIDQSAFDMSVRFDGHF